MSLPSKALFSGCATALITPFTNTGELDTHAFQKLLTFQIHSGMDALVVLGTTGEPCTISMTERETLIMLALEAASHRLPVIVGTGSNNTKTAVEYARQAKSLGADGQLCVTPYYNKASQNGLLRHYETIVQSSDLPLIIYNVPSRTGMDISVETVEKLAHDPRIAGIKEASGRLSLTSQIIEKTSGNLPLYCGNDDSIFSLMKAGACGCISVCSNLIPAAIHTLTHLCLDRNYEKASAIQDELNPLISALFSQVNPIPIKAALSMLGMIRDELRLPLTPMEEPHRTALKKILTSMNLI